MARHESSMVFMADGFARVSGRPGVAVVTPGPGLGNVVSGLMEAHGDDVPLLVIHIDTGRKEIGKGILHEVADPEGIVSGLVKATFVVSHPSEVVGALDEAYRTARTDRKGPVLLSIPYQFFEKEVGRFPRSVVDMPVFDRNRATEPSPPARTRQSAPGRIEEILRGKTRPVMIGGRSLMFQEARSIIDEMCSRSGMPFLTTTSGKGIVPEDRPYTFGNIMQRGPVREMIASADLVIAVGTRLRDVDAKRRGVKIANLLHIDVDDAWIGKNYQPSLAITGDVAGSLKELAAVLGKRRFQWNLPDLRQKKADLEAGLRHSAPGFRLMEMLRRVVPRETTVVCDLNYPSYWAEYHFPVYEQNTFLMPRGVSPIFYALPAGIGAKVGRPDRPCLVLSGDGGILPSTAEFATIMKYGIALVILLYNNGSFGILEDAMVTSYGIEGSMNLTNPDFVKLARSFGMKAKRVRTFEGLEKIFASDISWDEPVLIDYVQPPSPPPWRV